MKHGLNQAFSLTRFWLKLSSPVRVCVIASCMMVIFVLLEFFLVAQQNVARQASVTNVQSEAAAAELDSYFSRLSYSIHIAAKDQDLARMPVDIMYFGYAKQRLSELVGNDEAIVGAFVVDGSQYVLEGSPIETLGIRSKRVNKITSEMFQYESLRPTKPTLYLIPRDDVEFLLPLTSNASSWLLFGAPLVLERNDFLSPSEHTGVLWVAIDIVSLLETQLAGADLLLGGYKVHSMNVIDPKITPDVVVSPNTPILYDGKVARLHLYLQSQGGLAWWAFMPWMLLLLLALSIVGLYLFSNREQARLIHATTNIADNTSPILSADLSAIKALVENNSMQSSLVSQQLLSDKASSIESETRENSFRSVAKVLQRRLDDPLLKLSLASSVLQQYSSDRALLPVMEDLQQALEDIQSSSQQLQVALSGEVMKSLHNPREVMLEKLLANFYSACRTQGKDVIFIVDPVLHSRVMVSAEALEEILMATVRSKDIATFGDRFVLQLVALESNERQQVVRFVFFNDLYQADASNITLPEYIPNNTNRWSKISSIMSDLDLRLAAIYLQVLKGSLGRIEHETIGALVYFDIPLHVLDADMVMSNLSMNLSTTLRNIKHDQ